MQATVESGSGDDHGGQSRARAVREDLAGDDEAGPAIDHHAEDAHEMGRAPQRDIDAEQAMPEIIDGGGEDGDGHAPGGQMKPSAT
jgi:hypothetical protein